MITVRVEDPVLGGPSLSWQLCWHATRTGHERELRIPHQRARYGVSLRPRHEIDHVGLDLWAVGVTGFPMIEELCPAPVPKKSAQTASKLFHIVAAGHELNTMQDLILRR